MASRAAKFRQRVRYDRVLAESHRADIGEAGFFQSKMAGSAAVGYLLVGNPDLLNAAFIMALQCNGISTPTDEMKVLLLVASPLAEVVFGREMASSTSRMRLTEPNARALSPKKNRQSDL